MSDNDKNPPMNRRSSAAKLVVPGEAEFWHEKDGSLRFIARIVRSPCLHIWGVLFVALMMTMIAGQTFASFDAGEHDYDLDSSQAIKFDSLALASKLFEKSSEERRLSSVDFSRSFVDPSALEFFSKHSDSARLLVDAALGATGPSNFPAHASLARMLGEKSSDNAAELVHQQAKQTAPLLMTFEGADSVFTPSILKKMKTAEDITRKHAEYGQYCLKSYGDPADPGNNCTRPMSPINMFYASEWNTSVVSRVKSNLDTADKLAIFNRVGLCFAFEDADSPPYCIDQKASMTDSEWNAQKKIGTDMNTITEKWDGQSDTVANGNTQAGIDEILQFVLLLKKVRVIVGELRVSPTRSNSLFCLFCVPCAPCPLPPLRPLRTPSHPCAPYAPCDLTDPPPQAPLYGWKVDYYFDKSFSETNLKSKFTRSVTFFGTPLEGYKDELDREEEQDEKLAKWFKQEVYDDLLAAGDGELKVQLLFVTIMFEVLLGTIIADSMLANAAILMVWSFLWLQTGSCFIATMGMIEIVLSLPCAYFIYRNIFQIHFFGWTNAMALFLVLAIGADDVFVFMDAYKQSAKAGPEVLQNLSTRMTWVYKRAGLAMLITSATTCAAFLCTCLSPLASQISFGIFAALVIFCDYILVMTFFCTTVIIYHNNVEYRKTCGCETDRTGCCACVCCFQMPEAARSTTIHRDDDLSKVQASHENESAINLIKAFKFSDALALIFGRKIGALVLDVRVRAAILVVCLAWGIPSAVLSTKIQPTSRAEQCECDSKLVLFMVITSPFLFLLLSSAGQPPFSGHHQRSQQPVPAGCRGAEHGSACELGDRHGRSGRCQPDARRKLHRQSRP
jgi:hypothetical protein